MSDQISASTVWPAAQRTGINPIQHPAWEEARNAILDLAAAGPVTVILIGEAGTGKTWLLRELATALGEHGFPTMTLMQGDLPMTLSDGGALLVDEAARMNDATRVELMTQQRGVAVLADLVDFAGEIDPGAPTPVVIRLRSLEPHETSVFISEWLELKDLPPSAIDASARSRLVDHSRGTIRSIVQLLGSATTMGKMFGRPVLTGADIDEVAALRLGSLTPPAALVETIPAASDTAITRPVAETLVPSGPPIRPPRRNAYRAALAGTAIAASVALAWALLPVSATAPVRTAEQIAQPEPARSTLPPLQTATTSDPALVTVPAPFQPPIAAPPLALSPAPHTLLALAAPTFEPVETEPPGMNTAMPPDTLASPLPPTVLGGFEPIAPQSTDIATIDSQIASPPKAQLPRATSEQRGAPGLVLIARRGDTLESLYDSVYRDRDAPSYDTVVAANPGGFRPGGIVIFPAPSGGWQRNQR